MFWNKFCAKKFWESFEKILNEFAPKNKTLLETRVEFKNKIDDFYRVNIGKKVDIEDYIKFLKQINYIVPTGEDFKINIEKFKDEPNNEKLNLIVKDILNSGNVQKDDLTIVIVEDK